VVVTDWPVPPTSEQCEQIVETYARFHAFWWNDARLGRSIGAFLDTGALDMFVGAFPGLYGRFVDRLGDRLSAERRRLYERLIAAMPALLARHRPHRDLTLVNGDAHVWNLLYPRDAASADVRLIDWSHLERIFLAVDDLGCRDLLE
jgi:hypothetical protein